MQTVGSSKNEIEINELFSQAWQLIPSLQKQQTFNFMNDEDETILNFTKSLSNTNITAICAELIFGTIFDNIGFNISNQLKLMSYSIPNPSSSFLTCSNRLSKDK